MNKTVLYAALLALVLAVAVGINSILYTNDKVNQSRKQSEAASHQAVTKSEQAWCEVINTLNEAYSQIPPSSQLGQRLQHDFFTLKNEFHC